jgi:predicted enzyme related to lactoylglutathione lyase
MTDPWGNECRVTPILPVDDVPAAAAYYRDRLGFALRPWDPLSPDWWIVATRGTVEILLVPKTHPAGFAIRVADVDQLAAELRTRGTSFETGPTNIDPDERAFVVFDSNGTYIVFWQPFALLEEHNGSSQTEF